MIEDEDEDELVITDSLMEVAAPTSSLIEATTIEPKSIIEKDNIVNVLDFELEKALNDLASSQNSDKYSQQNEEYKTY